jgi:crotonobetainyl-CoA:carnitine CoA-transferase CaiB-like acyl-CoA transferase
MIGDLEVAPPPLHGIKVLDLSRVAAGPYCTMVLANLGADVIKVERPGVGDDSRHMDQSIQKGSSGYYLGINNNKRSIALDLKSEDAREHIHALTEWADVFLENFRPGVIERLGYGYEDLAAINPRLVYCSISAFGSHGPMRDRIGYDIIGQALSGIMDITGEPDRPPAKCGAPIADIATGNMAALGIVSALYQRTITGRGQKVETSLIGGAMSLLSSYLPGRSMGTPFTRVGSAHNTLAPYQAFEGSDGRFFILAVGNDSFWTKLTSAIGAPELGADPAYETNSARSRRREELAEKLQAIFVTKPAFEWVELLTVAGVPASEIYNLDDVIAEPHFREIGLVEEVQHPTIGPIPLVVTPLFFSNAARVELIPPPELDQQGEEIRELVRTLRADRGGALAP